MINDVDIGVVNLILFVLNETELTFQDIKYRIDESEYSEESIDTSTFVRALSFAVGSNYIKIKSQDEMEILPRIISLDEVKDKKPNLYSLTNSGLSIVKVLKESLALEKE